MPSSHPPPTATATGLILPRHLHRSKVGEVEVQRKEALPGYFVQGQQWQEGRFVERAPPSKVEEVPEDYEEHGICVGEKGVQ